MTIEIWSINRKDRNISLCLCGMMPLRNHFCKKSVPRGQHPPINSLHVCPWEGHGVKLSYAPYPFAIEILTQYSYSLVGQSLHSRGHYDLVMYSLHQLAQMTH